MLRYFRKALLTCPQDTNRSFVYSLGYPIESDGIYGAGNDMSKPNDIAQRETSAMVVVFPGMNYPYGYAIKLKYCRTPEQETALWAERC